MSLGVTVALALKLSTLSGPIGEALDAMQAPETLRAAFTVRLENERAMREFRYDPRLSEDKRWQLVDSEGEDDDLEEIAAEWGAVDAPDRRIFPESLRRSMGEQVRVDDFGKAWRLRFRHMPTFEGGALDIRFGQVLEAELWLKPRSRRFARLDYELTEPVDSPNGIRLTEFQQSYLLETDPYWGLSYISSYEVSVEAEGRYRTIEQDYTVQILSAEFFFTSPEARAMFEAGRQRATGPSVASR